MTARWLRRPWRRYRVQIAGATVLLALSLGVMGYGMQNPDLSMAGRFYAAIQLFSMGADPSRFPMPLPLEIARWLAPLTVAYALFRTLSAIFLQQWTQVRIWGFFRHHVIVFGLGEPGLRFATGFRDRGRRVVVVDPAPAPAAVEKCHESGIPILVGGPSEQVMLARAGVRRARYVVAVSEEDAVNAEVALAIRASSARRRSPIDCLVQLADEQLCQLVDQQVLAVTGPVSYEFFNAYHAGPAALFDSHADLLAPDKRVPPHLLVLGTERLATALVIEAARRWRLGRTRSAELMQITFAAPDADAEVAALEACRPVLATTCKLTPCSISPDGFSVSLRASNRAQAAAIAENLRTVGFELIPATDWNPPPLPFTETELEHLAVLEHQRWEAERRMDGWRPGNRDPVRKTSPYLLPWDDLPEEIKDLDRDAIRAQPTLLVRAGFAIARRRPPPPPT